MTEQSHGREHIRPAASTEPEPLTTAFAEPDSSTAFLADATVVPGEVIASFTAEPSREVPRVEVGQGGTIQFHDDTPSGRETVTEVTTDTFYAGSSSGAERAPRRLSVLTSLTLPVDLNAIADAVKAAQRNNGQPADPDKRVYVGSEGEMRMGSEASTGERIAEVTGDTFYMSRVNLDAVAKAVRDAQRRDGRFTDSDRRVYVDREGGLHQGSGSASDERVSEVTGDTFFASRRDNEAAFVRSNMPRNTTRVSDGTYEGWHFSITNEFGDSYSLFLYYHPSYGVYRVALIDPRMEGSADAHGTHLWPDGTLCLTHKNGSGYKKMGATYAKAALWTRGASCYRRGYGFQFNVGQD
jgi:hypothetical protein